MLGWHLSIALLLFSAHRIDQVSYIVRSVHFPATRKVIDVLGNISRKGRAKTEDIARAVNKLVDGAKKRRHDIRNMGRAGEAAGDAAKNLDDLLGVVQEQRYILKSNIKAR